MNKKPYKKSAKPEGRKSGDNKTRKFKEDDRKKSSSFAFKSKEKSDRGPAAGGRAKKAYAGTDKSDDKKRSSYGKTSERSGERSFTKKPGGFGKSADKPAYGKRSETSSGRRSSEKPAFKKRDTDSFFDKKAGTFVKAKSYRKDDSDKPAFRKKDDGASSEKRSARPERRSTDKPAYGAKGKSTGTSFDKKPRGTGRSTDKPTFKKKDFDTDKPKRSFTKDRSVPKSFRTEATEDAPNYKFKGSKEEADESGEIRLNRYIANSGICSRREADKLIEEGLIKVNGKVVDELGYKVNPGDVVKFENRVLKREKLVYVLLNKPKDFITTTDDPEERRTVMQLVANACKERIYPVGRLDRNTTGLLLLTNDGDLAKKLTHPSHKITKIYQVELDRPIAHVDFEKITNGIRLEDGPFKPNELAYVGPAKNVLGISIHEGRNRLVRRVFEHFDYEVVKLDRVLYAGLTKKDLPRGHWRYLEEKEVKTLKFLI